MADLGLLTFGTERSGTHQEEQMTQIDLQKLYQSANYSAGMSAQNAKQLAELSGRMQNQDGYLKALQEQSAQLVNLIGRMKIGTSGNSDVNIQRIENIPGRRVPYDLLVDINIPANATGAIQGTVTISQDGPFVAVSRMATCLSTMQYSVLDANNSPVAFNGRSFGRYRPIHSAWDLNDGRPHVDVHMVSAAPGTGAPSFTSPSNTSSFRSMQGDFRIGVVNQGSGWPRQNLEVPSTFWSRSINEPFELAALDFFERSEVIQFTILPQHVNNPPFGNISGGNPLNPLWPQIGSQFDAVEGINDQARSGYTGTTDPVTRLPNMIMTIGFHGYRIVQQPGVMGQ